MEVTLENVTSAFTQKSILKIRIKKHRRNLETVKLTTGDIKVKQELTLFIEKLHRLQVQLNKIIRIFSTLLIPLSTLMMANFVGCLLKEFSSSNN